MLKWWVSVDSHHPLHTVLKSSTVQSSAPRHHRRTESELGVRPPLGHRLPRAPSLPIEKRSSTLGSPPHQNTSTHRQPPLHLRSLASSLRPRLRRRRLRPRPLRHPHPLTNRIPLRPLRNRHRGARPRSPLHHRPRVHVVPGPRGPQDHGAGVPRWEEFGVQR